MTKKIISLAIFALAATGAFAKDVKNEVAVNPFSKNWEVTVGGGVQSYLGEYATEFLDFKDWWSAATSISVNRWVAPSFGWGITFNFSGYKGLFDPSVDPYATFTQDNYKFYKENFKSKYYYATGKYIDLMLKGNVNFTNLFWGYKYGRVCDWTGYAGGGFIMPVGNYYRRHINIAITAGTGVKFNVSERVALGLEAFAALAGDEFNGLSFFTSKQYQVFPSDLIIGAQAGVTVKFGKVSYRSVETKQVKEYLGWAPLPVVINSNETTKAIVAKTKAEAAAREARIKAEKDKVIAQKDEELKTAKETLTNAEKKLEAAERLANEGTLAHYWGYTSFAGNSTVLTDREKIDLMAVAEVINANPSKVFTVTGYADKQTGTPDYNNKLSEKRANAVAEYLQKLGVAAKQLQIEAAGGVQDLFFNQHKFSRAVIVSYKK